MPTQESNPSYKEKFIEALSKAFKEQGIEPQFTKNTSDAQQEDMLLKSMDAFKSLHSDDRDFLEETKRQLEYFRHSNPNVLPPQFIEFVEWTHNQDEWEFRHNRWQHITAINLFDTQEFFEYYLKEIKGK